MQRIATDDQPRTSPQNHMNDFSSIVLGMKIFSFSSTNEQHYELVLHSETVIEQGRSAKKSWTSVDRTTDV